MLVAAKPNVLVLIFEITSGFVQLDNTCILDVTNAARRGCHGMAHCVCHLYVHVLS
jgi:hypothetical protein